jgi:hypothetical protein
MTDMHREAQQQPLPCPFCGAKASRHKDDDAGSRWEYYCPEGHTSYLRMKEWNARHLTEQNEQRDSHE